MVQIDDFINSEGASLTNPSDEVREYFKDIPQLFEKDFRGYEMFRPAFSHSSLPDTLGIRRVDIKEADLTKDTCYFVGLHHYDTLSVKHLNKLNPDILQAIRNKKCKLVLDNVLEGNAITDFLTRLYISVIELKLPLSQIYYITNNIIADTEYGRFKDEHTSLIKDAGDTMIPSSNSLNIVPILWNAFDIKRLVKKGFLPKEVNIQEEIAYKANNIDKIKHFLKINRTGRIERDLFMLWVNQNKLYDKFSISFPGMMKSPEWYLSQSSDTRLMANFGNLLSKSNLEELQSKTPFDIDETDELNHGEPGFGINQFNADLPFQPQIYRDTFFSVVMCAFPYVQNACHIHSSTFNPMWCGHPVIQFGPYNHLKYLKQKGFKTFSKWWDESYDDIKDGDKRLKAVIEVVETLSKKSAPELLDMYMDMAPVLEYNIGVLRNYQGINKLKSLIGSKHLS